MKEISVSRIENFESFVNAMELNTKYFLPKKSRYEWVRIETGEDFFSKKPYFCWTMEYNYSVAGTTGYIYPLAGGNKVKHFKTEKGTKKNLVTKYLNYFNSLND